MRVVLACLACTAACGFSSPHPSTDPNDAREADAPVDGPLPPDAPQSLPGAPVALWEFNELPGALTVADTSEATPKVMLTVTPTVAFASGKMTIGPDPALVESAASPHLNADVIASKAVTLEAWVSAAVDDQGTTNAGAVIAGLSASINSRNIALMQIGKRWVARVRTSALVTPDTSNGKPDLTSKVDITPGALVHLVVVADATHRSLYVDGQLADDDLLPGAPAGWDKSYRMLLGSEHSQSGPWLGTYSRVAVYKDALTAAQIDDHFKLGPGDPP